MLLLLVETWACFCQAPYTLGIPQAYVDALGPLAIGDADLSQPRSYNSTYQKLAASTAGDSAAKMKVLAEHWHDEL